MSDTDYQYAWKLQRQFDAEERGLGNENIEVSGFNGSPQKSNYKIAKSTRPRDDDENLNSTKNLVHPQWEVLDPTPDIKSLFGAFDMKFFQSRLKCVSLEWSKKMYSCAGICYSRRNRFGMDITIRLSEPLLKLRPRKDLVETLLHEMIHAYCFVLHIREGNGGHGPIFKKFMYNINKVAGTNITVYHTFHDEVEVYRQHWWRCNGACQNRSPFFGYVRRATNRAPGPYDSWWANHKQTCGGYFLKIKGPDSNIKNEKSKRKATSTKQDIRKFLTPKEQMKKTSPDKTKKASSATTTSNVTIMSIPSSKTGKEEWKNKYAFVGSDLNSAIEFLGAVKVNGGGTMLLNPKTGSTTKPSISTAFPPSSYPGVSTDPFNISGTRSGPVVPSRATNMSWKDLETVPNLGHGYSLSTSDSNNSLRTHRNTTSEAEMVRASVRDVWSKRFQNGDKTQNSNAIDKDDPNGENPKRRRLSTTESEPPIVVEDVEKTDKWTVLDDDMMVKDVKDEVIALSSDEGETSDVEESPGMYTLPKSLPMRTLTKAERDRTIKQEILDDTYGISEGEIVLIDDEYIEEENQENPNDLDNSVIDEFFGEDTLLNDFQLENAVYPVGGRSTNGANDIISCPVCQNKLKRQELDEHLNGCTGIAIKVLPASHNRTLNKKKPVLKKKVIKTEPTRQEIRELLRKAGYTEEDLVKIIIPEDDDCLTIDSANNDNSVISISQTPNKSRVETRKSAGIAASTPIRSTINLDDSDLPSTSSAAAARLNNSNSSSSIDSNSSESSLAIRQKSLSMHNIQCPKCWIEIEESKINDHLDRCLDKSPSKK